MHIWHIWHAMGCLAVKQAHFAYKSDRKKRTHYHLPKPLNKPPLSTLILNLTLNLTMSVFYSSVKYLMLGSRVAKIVLSGPSTQIVLRQRTFGFSIEITPKHVTGKNDRRLIEINDKNTMFLSLSKRPFNELANKIRFADAVGGKEGAQSFENIRLEIFEWAFQSKQLISSFCNTLMTTLPQREDVIVDEQTTPSS